MSPSGVETPPVSLFFFYRMAKYATLPREEVVSNLDMMFITFPSAKDPTYQERHPGIIFDLLDEIHRNEKALYQCMSNHMYLTIFYGVSLGIRLIT